MKNIKCLVVGTFLLGLVSVFSPPVFANASQCDAVAGNLVKNCGFETGDFTDWTTHLADPSLTSLLVVSDLPHSGTFGAAFVNPFSDEFDSIEQSFATTAGTMYAVSFWVNMDFSDGELMADWNGGQIFDGFGPASSGYLQFSFSELAASSTSSIEFLGDGGFITGVGAGASLLDDVAVTPGATATAPEPVSSLLLGTGVLALAAFRCRRYDSSRGHRPS